MLAELRTHLERGNVPGFAARLETFVFGFAHENLQGKASFRVLMQALFRLMELPTQAEPSNWGGRADHVVHVGDRVYIFEVKFNRLSMKPCTKSGTGATDVNTRTRTGR